MLRGSLATLSKVAFSLGALVVAVDAATAQSVFQATGTGASPPFSMRMADTGQQHGIVVDLLTAISADAGFTVEYVEPVPFADLDDALINGTIDIIASGFAATATTAEQMLFSTPYFPSSEALVVPISDTGNYTGLADLQGKVIGSVAGNAYARLLEANATLFAEIKAYDNAGLLMQAVSAGEIEAALATASAAAYGKSQGQFADLRIVETYVPSTASDFAIAVSKDHPELLAMIDASLAKFLADGTVQGIFDKYGVPWRLP